MDLRAQHSPDGLSRRIWTFNRLPLWRVGRQSAFQGVGQDLNDYFNGTLNIDI